MQIHGIDNEAVKQAPTWEIVWSQVYNILRNKTFIAYNSEFDYRMICQSCSLYGIDYSSLTHECLMHNVMQESNSERFISLKNALGEVYQSHRAVDDCFMCLKLIEMH